MIYRTYLSWVFFLQTFFTCYIFEWGREHNKSLAIFYFSWADLGRPVLFFRGVGRLGTVFLSFVSYLYLALRYIWF